MKVALWVVALAVMLACEVASYNNHRKSSWEKSDENWKYNRPTSDDDDENSDYNRNWKNKDKHNYRSNHWKNKSRYWKGDSKDDDSSDDHTINDDSKSDSSGDNYWKSNKRNGRTNIDRRNCYEENYRMNNNRGRKNYNSRDDSSENSHWKRNNRHWKASHKSHDKSTRCWEHNNRQHYSDNSDWTNNKRHWREYKKIPWRNQNSNKNNQNQYHGPRQDHKNMNWNTDDKTYGSQQNIYADDRQSVNNDNFAYNKDLYPHKLNTQQNINTDDHQNLFDDLRFVHLLFSSENNESNSKQNIDSPRLPNFITDEQPYMYKNTDNRQTDENNGQYNKNIHSDDGLTDKNNGLDGNRYVDNNSPQPYFTTDLPNYITMNIRQIDENYESGGTLSVNNNENYPPRPSLSADDQQPVLVSGFNNNFMDNIDKSIPKSSSENQYINLKSQTEEKNRYESKQSNKTDMPQRDNNDEEKIDSANGKRDFDKGHLTIAIENTDQESILLNNDSDLKSVRKHEDNQFLVSKEHNLAELPVQSNNNDNQVVYYHTSSAATDEIVPTTTEENYTSRFNLNNLSGMFIITNDNEKQIILDEHLEKEKVKHISDTADNILKTVTENEDNDESNEHSTMEPLQRSADDEEKAENSTNGQETIS